MWSANQPVYWPPHATYRARQKRAKGQHEKGFMHIETTAGFLSQEQARWRKKSYLKHLMYRLLSNPYFPKSFMEQIAARLCISMEFINAYWVCLWQSAERTRRDSSLSQRSANENS